MRFKQALSRKLAAALSAVMILSTIAPTSVPVLAAAPDDVLVDSNVEYDLQDAGSEDVLLDSAESSLAEETDTLEVAGEELLAPETASDEVLVDSAEEVLSEETGIEPVETVEAVETPEFTEGEIASGTLTVDITSANIISKIKFRYVSANDGAPGINKVEEFEKEIEAGATSVTFGYVSVNTQKKLTDTDVVGYDANYTDGYAELEVSEVAGDKASSYANRWTLSINNTKADVFDVNGDYDVSVPVSINLVSTANPSVIAKRTAYDGTLKLNAVSSDLISELTYSLDSVTDTVDVSANTLQKEVEFTNVRDITVAVTGYLNETYLPKDSVYTLSVNKEGKKEAAADSRTFNLKEYGFVQDGNFVVNVNADIKKDYNKKGTVTIKVLSENTIGSKVVSINNITAQLGDYAIEWDGTSAFVAAKYSKNHGSVTVSGGDIKTNAPGLVKDAQGYYNIVLPYEYAKDVTIVVNAGANNGNNSTFTKYAYTLGNKEFYDNAAKKDGYSLPEDERKAVISLPENLTANSTYTLGIKQVSFDPSVDFTTTSANILDHFVVRSFDAKGGALTPIEVSAVNDSITKTKEFTDAKKISIAYNDFTPKGGLSTEVTDRSWVYQVTQGDKTKSLVRSGDSVEFEAAADGSIAPITVKTVPNVKITLSANATNRSADKKIQTKFHYWDANEFAHDITLTDSKYGSLYVEPGKVVSVNGFIAQQDYLFPYVVDAKEDEDNIGTFTLGSFDKDTTLYVDTKEFGLVQNVVIGTVNGKGSVSINNFTDAVDTDDDDPKSVLSNNKVFSSGTNLEVSFKLDSTEDTEYTFNSISYAFYNGKKNGSAGYGYGHKETKTVNNITKNIVEGSAVYTLSIPYADAKRTLLKDGKIEFTVNEYENAVKNELTLKSNPTGKIAKVEVTANGGVVAKELDTATPIAYNTPLNIKATPAKGWKLISVNIVVKKGGSVSQDQITDITDAKTLAEFTGNGYSGTKTSPFLMTRDTVITFNSEKDYALSAEYATGDTSKTVEVDKKGQYLVSHQRKVNLTYVEGDGAPAKFDYDILLGSKSIKSTLSGDAAKLAGNVLTLDPSNKEIVGKTVTVKFFTGDGSKTDSSVRTAVLVIDKENTGIKFKNDEEAVSLGTTATFKPTVTGKPSIALVVTPALVDGEYSWNSSNNTFTFKTTRTSSATKYTVKFVNSGDSTIEYAKLVLNVNTDAVKKAEAPKVSITGTSNRTLTVNLKANKIDTKIDGLAFKVKVTTSGQKKGYFEATKTVYVPITETSTTIDMMTAEAAADAAKKVDGDTDAKFTVEAWIVQVKNADITKAGAGDEIAISTASAKADPISPKEGKVFETSLKLKKISKGNAYTNMGKSNPFKIGVVYSKNTAVQQISKVEIFDKSGNVPYDNTYTLINPTDYLDFDNYTIDFMPAGKTINHETTYANQLKDGTYTIKAYALEPNSVEVSATIKIKVVQGIVTLGLDDSPAFIYKKAGKKATMQITALDTTKGIANATKAKKVEYYLTKAGDGSDDSAPTFAGKNGVDINKKNGKITVAKDFMIDGQTFYVKAVATDFATTKCEPVYSKQITIKTQWNSDLAFAFNANTQNIPANTTMDDLGTSYNVAELFGNPGGDDDYRYVTYVTVYDKEKAALANAKFVPATFKVSGAAKLIETVVGASDGTTRATVAKIGLKKTGTFKITAKANDGSDREIKNYTVTVKPEGTMGFYFKNSSNTQIGNLADTTGENAGKVVSVNNYAAEGDYITLYVAGYYKNTNDQWTNTFVNNKVSVKNGKLTKSYKTGVCDVYTIVPNDQITTVTITNTDTKTKLEVPVTNHAIGNKKNKTKVTVTGGVNGKGQIFSALDFSTAKTDGFVEYKDISCNKVTYNVTNAKKDAYALVSVVKDDTKKNAETYAIDHALWNNAGTLNVWDIAPGSLVGTTGNEQVDSNTYAFKLSGTSFSVEWITSTMANGQYYINPGTYKISITPAEKTKEGKFVATAKAATVSVPAKKAPKASVKPVATIKNVTANTATIEAGKYKNYIAKGGVKFTALLNVNNKGKHNNFHTNFQIDPDAKKNNVLNFVGEKPIDPKANKEEFQGWVEYKYQNLDGTTATQQIKVTIKATSQMKKK